MSLGKWFIVALAFKNMDFYLQDCMPNTFMLKPVSIQVQGIFSGQALANVSNIPGPESSRDRAYDRAKPQNMRDVKSSETRSSQWNKVLTFTAPCMPCFNEAWRYQWRGRCDCI